MKSSKKALIAALLLILIPLLIQIICIVIQLINQSADGFEGFDLQWIFYLIYIQGLGVAFLIISHGLKKENR